MVSSRCCTQLTCSPSLNSRPTVAHDCRQDGNTLQACSRARQCTDKRRRILVEATSHHDDCAHVFGEKGHIAGIPTCSKCTAVGARLRYTLRNRPHEFVALAVQEVQEIIARPDEDSPAAIAPAPERLRQRQEATQSQSSHYASMRARLEASLDLAGRNHEETEEPILEGILPGEAKYAELADVMYFWALAEAYQQHPQLQADMRRTLKRREAGPLAAGSDRLELRSRVQLLDGPFYEGSYLIGSVNFVRPAVGDSPISEGTQPGAFWPQEVLLECHLGSSKMLQHDAEVGSSSTSACRAEETGSAGQIVPPPSLEGVLSSDPGRMMMALEGDSPARMMRQGVAKTYNMYQTWGYFQRRMARERQRDAEGHEAAMGKVLPSAVEPPPGMPWRFFEHVPPGLCKLRTSEAASVAERHLRSLFGEQEECITTLQAWQQMTHEAKWFGRALHDAEEFVLSACHDA